MGVINWNEAEGAGEVKARAEGPVDRTGFFDNIGAGYKEALAGPGSTRNRQNAAEAKHYDSIIAALQAEGEQGEDLIRVRPGGFGYRGPKVETNQFGVGFAYKKRPFRNPYTDAPSLSQGDNPIARFYLDGDAGEKDAIWTAIERVRQRKPDFLKDIPTEGALRALADKERQRRLAEARTVTSRASGLGQVGAFVGNVAGSIAAGDPENFAGVGVGAAAGKITARTIIKRGVQEGAINAVAGVVGLPGQDLDRTEHLAEEGLTAKQAGRSLLEQFAIGAVFGAGAAAAPAVGSKAKAVAGKAVDAATSIPAVRDAVAAASLRAGTVQDRALLTEWKRLHNPYAIGDTSTPDERAAMHVVERDIEVREASPLTTRDLGEHENRLDAIAQSLGVSLKAPDIEPPAPVQTPTVVEQSAPRAASYEEAVHRAEGTGKNPKSSAFGHFQFTKGTWLEYAPRVANTAGMSDRQILALRQDRGVAEKAERLFRSDNAKYLRNNGVEDSPGNLSLAHFLGKADAAKVLKAAPDTPVERLVDPAAIKANKSVLAGKSASEVVAWAHKRIGAAVDGPVARPDSVPDFDPLDEIEYAEVRPYGTAVLSPNDVEVDANLMQYKSDGDEFGVTDKLKNVTSWNPLISSEILVWETADGRRVVVDGHQRTGLAKRLSADDDSIRLPAVVIREVDGITAQQARVLGALRNIALGTGSLLDNARVLRDAPNGGRMIEGAEHRRDIEGLAALSHEAFGATINGVLDPRIAARIGNVAGDAPDTHMSLADLLLKNRIHNPAEAETIIRQARADGFGTADAEQFSMFGDQPAQSLYVPIARILAAAEKRLREDKRTFRVLNERAGKIEAAGNVLDRTANEERVIGSDEALAILRATAHSSGPVRDALIAAARAELSGSGRGSAVGQFLDTLSDIDLRAAAAGVGRDDGPGSASRAEGGDIAPSSPDSELFDSLEPSLFDQAVAVREKAEAFSDPVSAEATALTGTIEHDLLMDAADPDAPSLFDMPDTGFRLDEEGTARPIADIMKDAEADELAAQAAAACLQPPKGDA